MKKLSECPQCQKRLTIIVLVLASLGVALGAKEIYQLTKKK